MLDLLIKNGHVIDPANRTDQVGNIAIYNGRITRYEEGEPARHVVDAAGRYVFPGLIDAHAHMFQEGTEIGIYPDVAYLPTGVTSAIDFSAGVANYPIFRSAVIARSRVTIKSFLQVCSAGLTTTSYHECINPKFFNPENIVRMYHDNQDNILGLKIRQSEELAEGLGIEPLKEPVRIAGCPVEVHCTNIPVPTSEVLKVLRPGDIFEHVYQGVKNTIIDENGKLYDCVREARKRGINAIGPVPPDTLFSRGKNGEFDAILAMYHDQGHMPCKTLDLERTGSVTLGLPFLRCSVDHGTAFDIAGKGIATNVSMTAAIDSTVKYAKALHDAKQDENMENHDAK